MENTDITRKSLILRAADPEDHDAFEEFISYYERFITIIIYKTGVFDDDAEDFRQELTLKLWKSLNKFSFDEKYTSFRSWLKTVIKNGIFEYNKKRSRERNKENLVLEEDNSSDLDLLIDSEWKKYVIDIALTHVKKMFTGCAIEVFLMSMEQIPAKEIAQKLNIRESTVYNLRLKVKAKFQSELKNIRQLLEFHQ